MLEQNFFDIINLEKCEYQLGNYLVTVFTTKKMATFHQIVEISDVKCILSYVAHATAYPHTKLMFQTDAIQPITVDKSRMGKNRTENDYCIAPDTFNLLILNYAQP